METLKYTIQSFSFLLVMTCCTQKENANQAVSMARPSVSVTTITNGEMHKTEEFNVYSVYQKKESIRAPISGYIQSMLASPGGSVRKGASLVVLQTQEARALANTKLKNDSLIGFEGTVKVSSPKSGIVNIINYQEGAFVQQGEQLMEMVSMSSIVFIMNVPYENIDEVKIGGKAIIKLPGDRKIKATIGNRLPIATTSSQVQSFILRPDSLFYIPENLNAVSEIIVGKHQNAQRLNKKALMTNETQTNYWVMKMINDSTAVKVEVVKGIETKELVEIKSPVFEPNDRILLEGQYGLPDSAIVKIISPQ